MTEPAEIYDMVYLYGNRFICFKTYMYVTMILEYRGYFNYEYNYLILN
jgi:hypothetical protein